MRDAPSADNPFKLLIDDIRAELDSQSGSIAYNILEFIEKEVCLGIELTRQQKLPLKLLYNLPLDDLDIAILEYWQKAKKTNWAQDFSKELGILILESGRRSGKTSIAAIIAVYEFYCLSRLENPQMYYKISTSTPIGILVLATTAEQAKKGIFREVIGIVNSSPYFKRLKSEGKLFVGKEEISYADKQIYLQSGNSRSASQVGGTLKCFIMDEVARFEGDDGENNALLLWQNLGISCAPFAEAAKRVAISSAWCEGDAIETLIKKNEDNPRALTLIGKSWEFNPIHAARDNPIVDSEYRTDPVRAALEFEGIRPSVADAFLNAAQVERAFKGKNTIIASSYIKNELTCIRIDSVEARPSYDSVAHIDPSVSSDGYALAYGHAFRDEEEEFCVQIDGFLLWQPSFEADVSYVDVGDAIRTIHARRPLQYVTADHYNSPETIQRLKQSGINAEIVYFSGPTQLQMYDLVRQLLHLDRLILPTGNTWGATALRELKQISLIKGRKIDHPKSGSKDIADAVAAVVWKLSEMSYLANKTKTIVKEKPLEVHLPRATPSSGVIKGSARRELIQQRAASRKIRPSRFRY